MHRGEITRFGYDGDEVRVTFDGDNQVSSWLSTDPGGGLLAEWSAATGTVREAITDQLGSRTGWLSGEGVERTPRDAFGNPVATPDQVEPHAFTWHAQDPTGLVYARARYLDPRTGRFLSEDPIEAGNLYTYAGNNPVGMWDPYGATAASEEGSLFKRVSRRVVPGAHRIGVRVACMISQAAEVAEVLGVAISAGGGAITVVADVACSASGGGKCFTAGTPVAVPGGTIPIEQLTPGSRVLALNGTGQVEPADVLQTFVRSANEVIEATIRHSDGRIERLTATPDHPFYDVSHRGYVDLAEAEVGTALLTQDGERAVLIGKTSRRGSFVVYNLEVAQYHNYFVGEGGDAILVHNAKYKPPGPCGRRINCTSKKEAYERAKRAGGGRQPKHHPDGEHGPHYHPDVGPPKYPWSPDAPVPKTPAPHDHYYYPR